MSKPTVHLQEWDCPDLGTTTVQAVMFFDGDPDGDPEFFITPEEDDFIRGKIRAAASPIDLDAEVSEDSWIVDIDFEIGKADLRSVERVFLSLGFQVEV